MSAFDNFLGLIRPSVAQRRYERMLDAKLAAQDKFDQRSQRQAIEALQRLEDKNVQVPYQLDQAEIFDSSDPILNEQMKSEAIQRGLLRQGEAKQFAGLLANPVTKSIGEGLFDARLGIGKNNGYSNIQIEPTTGRAWGFNKSTSRFEPIPTQGQFESIQTVQGADDNGIPTQELVIPTRLNQQNGRIRLSTKPPVPSSQEAQQEAQRNIGVDMLDRLSIVSKEVDMSPSRSMLVRSRAGTGPAGSLGATLTPGNLTKHEAELLSLEQALSNQLLAAMRGAQVGPAEQEKFERQLPVFGQEEQLYRINLENTRKNLIELDKRISTMRGRSSTIKQGGAPAPPPGFTKKVN